MSSFTSLTLLYIHVTTYNHTFSVLFSILLYKYNYPFHIDKLYIISALFCYHTNYYCRHSLIDRCASFVMHVCICVCICMYCVYMSVCLWGHVCIHIFWVSVQEWNCWIIEHADTQLCSYKRALKSEYASIPLIPHLYQLLVLLCFYISTLLVGMQF